VCGIVEPVPSPKSGKRLAHDAEERNAQVDAMLRRARLHRERAKELVAKARRARALATRLLKQAAAKRREARDRTR
jgi:hypothetical protein